MRYKMKQSIFILLLVALCSSCSPSLEEKAQAYVENDMNTILNYPETYESVQTRVDSAFASIYFDYEAYMSALEIVELQEVHESLERQHDMQKSLLTLHSNMYSEYDREAYRQTTNEINKLDTELKRNDNEIKKCKDLIKSHHKEIDPTTFVGWGITHRFRCTNATGHKSIHDVLVIVDETFENTIMRVPLDKNDPQGIDVVSKIIDEILEEENNKEV